AVHPPKNLDARHALAAERPERAAGIADVVARQRVPNPVCDAGLHQTPARVPMHAIRTPTARTVRVPFANRLDECWDVGRRILEVTVHRDQDVGPGAPQPRLHRRALTAVALEAHQTKALRVA